MRPVDLKRLIRKVGRLSPGQAIPVACQILSSSSLILSLSLLADLRVSVPIMLRKVVLARLTICHLKLFTL